MKLNEEMKNKAISSRKIFTPYDDNHILLLKPFTCKNNEIDDYISRINDLKQKGIKTAGILDYERIYRIDTDYPTCVILEEKAPGRNINPYSMNVSLEKADINFEQISAEYIYALKDYINEINLRASAPQEVYDKFVEDFLYITSEGFQIDPKPLNFFFDPKEGFTFIDINANGPTDLSYLPKYILGGILGYGLPSLRINWERRCYITPSMYNIIETAMKQIIEKVSNSLVKKGYSKEKIESDSLEWLNQLKHFIMIGDIGDISVKLSEDFASIKTKEEEKSKVSSNNDSDWTIGW